MRARFGLLILLVIVLAGGSGLVAHRLASVTPATTGCGVEFWAKKTGIDPAAQKVNLAATTWASVHSLQQYPAPAPLTSSRSSPVETIVWRMTVTLLEVKAESDSDYHLVIQGTSGRQMIAEIPSPTCVEATSPFLPGVAAARQAINDRYAPSGSWRVVNAPVTLTGVGFFDFLHSQTGVAPNGVELHPVLSIHFR